MPGPMCKANTHEMAVLNDSVAAVARRLATPGYKANVVLTYFDPSAPMGVVL